MVGLKLESIVYCQNGSGSATGRPPECAEPLTEERTDVAIAGGGGFRFWIVEGIVLKVELFDITFFDEYREQVDRALAEAEQPGSTPAQGTPAGDPGLTNLIFVNIGASFQF